MWRCLLCLALGCSLGAEEGLRCLIDGQAQLLPPASTRFEVTISGSVARVSVQQTFVNPLEKPAEAIYSYPLSHRGAIDRFELRVGDTRIRGVVVEKAAARAIYDDAKRSGRTAGLLEQRRPNVFSQRLGNIPPGDQIQVQVGYTEMLVQESGVWRFHVPVSIGQRFNKDGSVDPIVVDGAAVPAVSARIDLHTAMPHHHLEFPAYQELAEISRPAADHSRIQLRAPSASGDIVCRWRTTGDTAAAGILLHRPHRDRAGYLALHLEPADWRLQQSERVPTDWCFLLDISGSMNGAPHQQALQAITALRQHLDPANDRVQLVNFTGRANSCFSDFVPASAANCDRLERCAQQRQGGGGGTRMVEGFRTALGNATSGDRRRMVVLLSDGFIGFEDEVLQIVQDYADGQTRFAALGIGDRVNRHLIDGVGRHGHGISRILLPEDDAGRALLDIGRQVSAPQITDITIDWGGLSVDRIAARFGGSLFPGQPLHCLARFQGSGRQTITITGRDAAGNELRLPITVEVPSVCDDHPGLPAAWARALIADLEMGLVAGEDAATKAAMTELATKHQLLSRFTSFIAVDPSLLPVEQRTLLDGHNGAMPLPVGITIAIPEAIDGSSAAAIATTATEMGGPGAFMAIGGNSSGIFGLRYGGGRRHAVGRYGGSRASESAVDIGLRFCMRHQSPDGRWDVDGYPAHCQDGGPLAEAGTARTDSDGDVLLTGEVLAVFLGSGYDHRNPSMFRQTVKKGLDWLIAQQAADGRFASDLAAHSSALRSLAEAYGMTNDPAIRQSVERGCDWLRERQHHAAGGGGWGPEATSDMPTTTIAGEALRSVKFAGVAVGDAQERLKDGLSRAIAATPAGEQMPRRWHGAGIVEAGDRSCSYAAWWTLILLGARPGDADYDRVAALGLPRLVGEELDPQDPSLAQGWPGAVTANLWRTLAIYQHGGAAWKAWNGTVRDALIEARRTDPPCLAGSFDPRHGEAANRDDRTGRLFITARTLRCLEVYYYYKKRE